MKQFERVDIYHNDHHVNAIRMHNKHHGNVKVYNCLLELSYVISESFRHNLFFFCLPLLYVNNIIVYFVVDSTTFLQFQLQMKKKTKMCDH